MKTMNQNGLIPRPQLPNRQLLFITLLVMAVASSPLVAQAEQGKRTMTFLGERGTLAASAPVQAPRGAFVKPHLPTMDFDEYAYLKAAANASISTSAARLGSALESGSTSILNFSFLGKDRLGSADQGFIYAPPDVNTAMGLGQIVEVTNNHFTCFDTTGTVLQDTPMSVFFGYTGQLLTDPRVVYDHIWNRFIVTEVGFSENPTTQFFFIAASTSSDCTGSFNVYRVNMPLAPGDFYDYPQTGYDQDALIFTFNVFNGPFKYAEVDMVAKAAVYNGRGISMSFFNGLPGTLTPNLVRDGNGTTVLIRNAPGTANIQLIKLANTSRNNPSFTGPFNVNTGFTCQVPANASQPGTVAVLDTLDSRFQAPGTQIGNSLYQTQTCGPGLPTPRVVQIDIAANTLTRQDFVSGTASSFDFNPSVAANDIGDALVNWSSTDPSAGNNAATLFSSKLMGANFGPLGSCFQSPTFSTAFRWGDTSAASVDPTDPTQKTFLISNETIQDASNWGTIVCSLTAAP